MTKIEKLHHQFNQTTTRFGFLPQVLSRVTLGMVFMWSGWGKFQHLDQTIEFFQSIGVPLANFQAPMVAVFELIGGILILMGLATRLVCIPLIGIMIVAIMTAKWADLEGISSLFETSEFLYILLLTWLGTVGAGRLSLDQLVFKKT